MHRNLSSTSTVAGKRMLPSVSERPSKRAKLESSEAGTRKEFLNSLRAICDRWAVHVKFDDGEEGVVDGVEVLRRFLRDTLPPKGKKFPLQECGCRHGGGYLPLGVEMCRTSGTVDKNKAQGFVMSDFKQSLREWLRSKQSDPNSIISDVEDSDLEEEAGDAEEAHMSQPISLSSFDALKYPSSPQPGDSGYARKSTKQRLPVLFYLVHHSNTRETFKNVFKQLCKPDLYLVHLCGCGLNTEALKGACVVGSHLKLAPSELNREHVHYHFVLAQLSSKESYLTTLDAIKGSSGGKYDDIF
jgi:hypothetical protein